MRLQLLYIFVFTLFVFDALGQDTLVASGNFTRGQILLKNAKYDSALIFLNQALAGYEQTGYVKRQVQCLNSIAQALFVISRYDEAMKVSEKAIKVSKADFPGNQIEEARAVTMLGSIYANKGQYDVALKYHNEALPTFIKEYGAHHLTVAKIYRNIMFVHYYAGALDLAMEYEQKALETYLKIHGKKHPAIAKSYTNIGLLYAAKNERGPALKYFGMAMEMYKSTNGETNPDIASLYNNIGTIYQASGDYKKALTHYQKALSVYSTIVGDRHPSIALFNSNIGAIYSLMGDQLLANDYYERALSILKKIFGNKHQSIKAVYMQLAENSFRLEKYDDALKYYQLSIVSNVTSFDNEDPHSYPMLKDYLGMDDLLQSINGKASVFLKKYKRDKKLVDLNSAYKGYKLCDSLISMIRDSRQNTNDKLELGKYAITLYENAINACIQLHSVTNDQQYLERAFYYSERNKAKVLTDMVNALNAKGIGLLPEELLDLEKQLKSTKSQLQSKIQQLKSKPDVDSTELFSYHDKIFNLNRKLDSLEKSLAKNYPRYQQLTQQQNVLELRNVQEKLPERTTVLEYFEGNEYIYCFLIGQKHFYFFSHEKDSAYEKSINNLRRSISQSTTIQSEEAYRHYFESAHDLFKQLLNKPLEKIKEHEGIDKIVIVPDGLLSYIPFEVLLTNTPSKGVGDYATLDYLMKDYTLTYAYSATLMYKDYKASGNAHLSYISFGPSYPFSSNSLRSGLRKFRDAASPLKWNQHEAEVLSAKVGADYYVGENATETRFKKEAHKYNVIHLAMHALVDDQDPMNSMLMFTSQKDSTDDGFLHAFELYNMQLNAQLVVLSACNTGYGQLAKGEGILSLARAFSYAGVPSIVMSHWSVDDEATSQLMQLFYENLADGMTKSEALKQAKTKYLLTANPAQKHPFYWAAFVSVGNDSPLEKRNKWHLVAGIGAALLITTCTLAWIALKKRRNQKQQISPY